MKRTRSPRQARCRRAALGIALSALASTTASGQGNQGTPRPFWASQYPPDLGMQMTAGERAAAMATMREIESILAQVPELARPRGFRLYEQVYGGTNHLGERSVFAYSFILWFFPPSQGGPKGEGSRCIGVTVNNFGVGEGRPVVDEAGRFLYVERESGDPMPGATIVHEGLRWDTPNADRRSGYVKYTTHGTFPWIPVSREEYLRAQIYETEGKNGEKEKEFKKDLEKTSYDRWMEQAAERKKNRDDAVASMERAQGRAAAADLRKTLENSEREVTEQLKAAEAEERKQGQAALGNRYGDILRGQIAAMTPAERASPATAGASGALVAAGEPKARRVLTPDPEFWRVRKSRVEAHSIDVGFSPTNYCALPAVRAALEKVYHTLDGAAFRRIVDRTW